MKQIRSAAVILSVLLATMLFSAAAAAAAENSAGVSAQMMLDSQTNNITDLFSANLPLIVLEVPDAEIVAGAEESTPAVLSSFEITSGNKPDNTPRFKAEVTLNAIRYESDEPRPKRDYFFRVTDNTKPYTTVLSDVGQGERWFLLGGAYDKSLIRNYIGYTLAKSILPDAPDVRLCELLLKTGGGYEYQGVYLLVEGIGNDDMVTARITEHYWEGFNQTVVSDGAAGVFVLLDDWSGGTQIDMMGVAIENATRMFASGDTNYYLQYSNVLDTDSFYAYFLINELMANYEAMSESVYTYDPATRKLSVGPIMNFERALDNRRDDEMNLRILEYQSAPFYSHMIIDSEFVNGLINTSKNHAEVISGTELCALIDRAVAEIGAAQERDWYRWGYFYLSDENSMAPYYPQLSDERVGANGIGYTEDGKLLVETEAYYVSPEGAPERVRQFSSYEQEIIKLKHYANERPAFVRKAVLLLKNQDELLTEVNAYGKNSIWAVLFLAGFLISIVFARKTAGR